VKRVGLLVLLAGLVIVGAAAARSSQPEPSYVIQGDNKIGHFAVKRNGTLSGAQAAFGDPTSIVRGRYQNCRVSWRSAGLSMQFYNLGGQDACEPEYGYFSRAIMRGSRWRTAVGLRIGAPTRRIRHYYPRAVWHPGERHYWPSGWWLVVRPSPFGPGDVPYPALLAETRNGRVSGFHVRYPAGGD
jgi:hypothetical protein